MRTITAFLVSGACAAGSLACGADTDLLTSTVIARSTRDGGGADSGSGSSSATACQALKECCTTSLPIEAQQGCSMLIAEGSEPACTQALEEVEQVGYCGGSSGTGSGPGTPLSGSCAELESCCDALPDDAMGECQTLAATGDQSTCSEALSGISAQGFCVGSIGGGSPPSMETCTTLAACCGNPDLSPQETAKCGEIVAAGDPGVCTAGEGTYCVR